jgi:hypothetical protein
MKINSELIDIPSNSSKVSLNIDSNPKHLHIEHDPNLLTPSVSYSVATPATLTLTGLRAVTFMLTGGATAVFVTLKKSGVTYAAMSSGCYYAPGMSSYYLKFMMMFNKSEEEYDIEVSVSSSGSLNIGYI